jgi:predicted nucleotidyltransferase
MEFDVFDHTEYLVIAGSHAYGMATETSDLDVRGWCIPPVDYFRSFHKNFEQTELKITPRDLRWLPKDYKKIYNSSEDPADVVIYDIRKFFKLAAVCNPSIIELLFIDPSETMYCSEAGRSVRENATKFLSGRAKFSFSGYARAQLKRINTHRRWLMHPPTHKPERSEYGLPDVGLISPENRGAAESLLEKQARLWLLEEAEVDKSIVSSIQDGIVEMMAIAMEHRNSLIAMLDSEKLFELAKLAASKKYKFDENYIVVLQAEKKYRNALTEWNQYQNWILTRNKKRAESEAKFSYDCKHAAHLVRLMMQCKEILTKGTLNVKDKERAKLLLEVRNGAWTYNELIDFADTIEAELDSIYQSGSYLKFIPKSPDINFLDDLCQDVIKERHERDLY